MKTKIIAILAILIPSAAFADAQVSLTSRIAVERIRPDANGTPMHVLEEPKMVTPGDKLLFSLDYRNSSAKPAVAFVVTDPLPAAVTFVGNESKGAVVSVDGGKSFGPLSALSVVNAAGSRRSAQASDVTHIRWTFGTAIPAGSGGTLSFEGVVR